MFPLEKLNAGKSSFTWKMNSSEEEELFLLGFILLDDKRKKKKKQRNVDFGFVRYFASVKDKECFQIFLLKFNLIIENIILNKYLFDNISTSVFDKILKVIRFFDIYIQLFILPWGYNTNL